MSISVTFDYDIKKRKGILQSTVFPEVREYFSVKIPKFGAARYNKHIPDRKYVITATGRFDVGLYWEIYKYINRSYVNVEFLFTDEFRKVILLKYDVSVLNRGLRDYQEDIVQKCLNCGMGTVVLATAGGKSFSMAALVESINPVKCILIVPDPGLVEQMYNDFIKYGIKPERISRWTGVHEIHNEANIVIANRSILQSKCSDTEWIKYVDLVLVDEVQTLKKDNGITDIVSSIITPHKYGFTGTLPENDIDRWTIMGITGPIIYQRKAHELREDKYVSEVKALILKLHYKSFIPEITTTPNEAYRKELEWLIRSEFRTNTIGKICGNFNKNALLLVDRLEHGEILKSYISNLYPDRQVYFINGEMEVEDRERIKKIMETDNNVLCIAMSKIFAVGISINNLHYIVFCSGGKSRVRVIQSIGRGLRLHKSKSILTIIDIADQLKYGILHSDKRKLLYNEEKIPFTETELTEL